MLPAVRALPDMLERYFATVGDIERGTPQR